MIGLRWVERDAEVPARGGDPGLASLAPQELQELVERHVLAPGVFAGQIRWEHARWKPGVAACYAYSIDLPMGEPLVLVAKHYASDKLQRLARRSLDRLAKVRADPRVRAAYAVDETRGIVLWTPAADRALPGLRLVADPRRLARELESLGVAASRDIRRSTLDVRLLRYKPERRAVVRVGWESRASGAARAVALRALPVAAASALVDARRSLGWSADAGWPRLVAALPEKGIVIESWQDGLEATAPGAFEHAARAGRALARLHAWPLRPNVRDAPRAPLEESLAVLARFRIAAAAVPHAGDEAASSGWIHGDFHADQLGRGKKPAHDALFDLDSIGCGDPLQDVASWTADRLVWEPACSVEHAVDSLRTALGRPAEPRRLGRLVAAELMQRAAAALRRCEAAAVPTARELAARALELGGTTRRHA